MTNEPFDSYFYRRAEAELKMARRATGPEALKVHCELASRYLDRFYNPDGQWSGGDGRSAMP
jgi:hypothetical protein